MLLAVHPSLEKVDIRLDKPAALDGRARAAAIEIERYRADFSPTIAPAPFGRVETFLETREASFQLLHIEPGRRVPAGHGAVVRMLEWVVVGDLAPPGGAVLPRHVPVVAATPNSGTPNVYENRGDEPAVLFRCVCSSS